MKILLDFQNGMRAVTLNSEFSLCGLTVTHFSFFVEFLFPSFGKVSLHISKLVKGGHKVTTVLISG